MPDRKLSRRRVIRTTGVAALLGLAGCSGESGQTPEETDTPTPAPTETEAGTATSTPTPDSPETGTSTSGTQTGEHARLGQLQGPRNGDQLPKDTNPDDGYPPEFQTVPEKQNIDPSKFGTLMRGGMEIKLVPTDVAYYWYARREARFADTRSQSEFDVSHIFGAVLSPAGDGVDLPDDPVLQWPKDTRIITYCDCPHHLSSLRAASLKKRGYETVYALDEGFSAWRDQNYPLAGKDIGRVPPTRVITGKVPRRHAGGWAWAYHTNSNQREAVPISDNGSYELELRFVDVNDQSKIRVETPAYTVTGTLGELTSGSISTDGSISSSGGTSSPNTTTGGTGWTTTGTSTDSGSSIFDL